MLLPFEEQSTEGSGSSSPVLPFLLLESGDEFVLESGSGLIQLES